MALVAHQPRPTRQVFEDHLDKRRRGLLEEDLAANYAEDVVLLTVNSNGVGHDAIRHSAARLDDQMPTLKFEFVAQQVNGRFALLIWRGYSSREGAIDGADTFVIENGLIRLQTIHYRLVRRLSALKMIRRPGDRASFQAKDQANCSCRPPRHIEASGSIG